eukprot:Cvel_32722.t1-p1 / transcript=Cvel_32722.t1 / gene=Cvel_32722 / organism=Chromera_velia_CCMP2878 / gene_product=hypothetical protein / transcript_product=hypothetical protein / location=Cvel_scaffold5154:5383-5937(+) / protein_length=185 / sequence_SO=supercontig / SO=protein_coding / is_pseudo=false
MFSPLLKQQISVLQGTQEWARILEGSADGHLEVVTATARELETSLFAQIRDFFRSDPTFFVPFISAAEGHVKALVRGYVDEETRKALQGMGGSQAMQQHDPQAAAAAAETILSLRDLFDSGELQTQPLAVRRNNIQDRRALERSQLIALIQNQHVDLLGDLPKLRTTGGTGEILGSTFWIRAFLP